MSKQIRHSGELLVYKIVCEANKKVYIGITIQGLRKRWAQHVSLAKSGDTKLARAIRKYGSDSFSIEAIACARSIDDLYAMEIIAIKQYDSIRSGMNISNGGEGNHGYAHTEESRAKMSKSQLALAEDKELSARRSESAKSAWLKKSDAEIQERRARASDTFKKYRKEASVKKEKSPPKDTKPFLGKGHNMKIKTHCPSGHPYSGDNLLVSNGSRNCRTCKRASRNLARDARRAAARPTEGASTC